MDYFPPKKQCLHRVRLRDSCSCFSKLNQNGQPDYEAVRFYTLRVLLFHFAIYDVAIIGYYNAFLLRDYYGYEHIHIIYIKARVVS